MAVAGIEQARFDTTIGEMKELLSDLQAHPGWAEKSPSILFMWDFINRSRDMLIKLPETKSADGEDAAKEVLVDVFGRNTFAQMLMEDTSGKFAMMVGADPSNPVDFTEPIKTKAREVAKNTPSGLPE